MMNKVDPRFHTDHLSLVSVDDTLPTCGQCHYHRRLEDNAPAWSCPACGVAYGTAGLELDNQGRFYATRLTPRAAKPRREKSTTKIKRKTSRRSPAKLLMGTALAGLLLTIALTVQIQTQRTQGPTTQPLPQAKTTTPLPLLKEKDAFANNQ